MATPPLPAAPAPWAPEAISRLRGAVGQLSRRLRPTPASLAAGLSPTRAYVLLSVVREGRVRLSELAEGGGINPTMLSRLVADLSAAGLIERVSDSGDRRAAWIRPTAAGRRLADRIRRERDEALEAALTGLPSHHRDAIHAATPALEALAAQLAQARR